ncbi:hypothetical protein M3P05_15945 [Sansalvadorimonas sp. 2012CJ34-2]|uniref:Uncharacterized protein n=1 Tax=Parendozoicomonas callyspongiae TaxID=2942213 RepID=A0ABT0PJ78_9GAMM|nr:hypothetical protein [Sansalvadorimonas sp. 2012CJ34-2]MCL6271413.1 hypothetical protein [Sansalvadorimonas sp. 2012CJ34-2]
MLRSKLIVIILLLFSALSAPLALSAEDRHGVSLLPPEIQQRMLSENGSLTSWYVRQEAWNILTMAGVMAGTYALTRQAPSWLPLGHLMTAAGIALDYKTSQTWTEFYLRQGALLPVLAVKQIQNGIFHDNELSPLEDIATEIPNIFLSLYEIGEQQRSGFHGVTKIRLSQNSLNDLPPLYLSTAPCPTLTFYISQLDRPACPDPTGRLHNSLSLMVCEAYKKHFSSISFIPEENEQTASLKVILRGDKGYRQLVIEQARNSTPWITDILTSNQIVHTASATLNPLSENTIQQVSDFIAGDLPTSHITMTTNEGNYSRVLGGNHLQTITLGSEGFLLVDHSLSQGTLAPDIWIDTTAPAGSITQKWLDTIESRLTPGAGKGLWRLSSALKSVLYRSAMKYGFSWINDSYIGADDNAREPQSNDEPSPPEDIATEIPCPFDPEQLTTRDLIAHNNQIQNHLESAKQQISQTPGKVIVVLDDRTNETAQKRTQFAQMKDTYSSQDISTDPVSTQTIGSDGNMRKIVNINPQFLEDDDLKSVKQMQEEWIKRADKVLTVVDNENLQNIRDINPACRSRALNWLRDISARAAAEQSTSNKTFLFYSDIPFMQRGFNSGHQTLPNNWRFEGSESSLHIWCTNDSVWRAELNKFMTR